MKRKRFHDECFGLGVICSFLVCFLGFIWVRQFVFVEVGICDGLLKEFLNFINSKQSVEGKKSTIELSEDKGEQ
ncbi:hypothetical protein [Vibrio parahaemolyticus]|uniref:hypothetical protein n=1 Tax=Vibrio parahaemolyticus TaxID=670 RepID=UPI0005F18181|nr:hypothetical protein [Vibrio parahaemolyticus]